MIHKVYDSMEFRFMSCVPCHMILTRRCLAASVVFAVPWRFPWRGTDKRKLRENDGNRWTPQLSVDGFPSFLHGQLPQEKRSQLQWYVPTDCLAQALVVLFFVQLNQRRRSTKHLFGLRVTDTLDQL